MSQDTAEVANDKPVPSRREGALRHTKGGKKPERQQRQKSLKRHSPKEENNSSQNLQMNKKIRERHG